jgi:hypothetical protein
MAVQTWIIAALLVISYYQYTSPTEANEMLKPIWSPVKDFVGNKAPNLSGGEDTVCPDTVAEVCGNDGVTYKNSCEAALKGIVEVTAGAC